MNDAGLSLYTEARLLEREDELPKAFMEHVAHCPQCQQEILDLYEFVQEDDLCHLVPHPFLDCPQPETGANWLLQWTRSAGRAAAMVLLTVVSGLAYLIVSNPARPLPLTIVSPFAHPALNVPYQSFVFQADKAQSLYLSEGTYISLPAQSFVYQDGRPVRGPVLLRYRELHSAADIIASGVPTLLGEGQPEQWMESAGMFEIRGEQNGQPIFIAPGKKLYVHMATRYPALGFQQYYLDEDLAPGALAYAGFWGHPALAAPEQAKWRFIGPSQLSFSNNLRKKNQDLLKSLRKEIDSLAVLIQKAQQAPIPLPLPNIRKPALNTESQLFSLSFNTRENPELSRLEGKVWKYAGENLILSPTLENQWVLRETWDEARLKVLKYKPLSLKGHQDKVQSVAFSSNGRWIVTASADHTAKIWSNEAQYLLTLKGHQGPINSACFSPRQEEYILTASDDHTAKIWSFRGNLMTTLHAHSAPVIQAQFSPNGLFILTQSLDQTVCLWNHHGQKLYQWPHRYGQAAFSPDSRYVITLPDDNRAVIWDMQGRENAVIPGNFSQAIFSNQGKYILTTARATHRSAQLWDTEGRLLKDFSMNAPQLIFSPDDQYIASYSQEGARLWFLNPAKSFNTVLIRNMRNLPETDREGHNSTIHDLRFSPRGNFLASASADHTAKIWTADGKILHTLREHLGKVNQVVFSPDERQILTASDDFTAKLWVEREIQDTQELLLIKHDKHYRDDVGKRVKITGKRFYTTVRSPRADEMREARTIKTPTPEENPLHPLTTRYEAILREIALRENRKFPEDHIPLLDFEVSQFGYYGCNRAYTNAEAIACKGTLRFDKNYSQVRLYLITGVNETVIIPYHYHKDNPLLLPVDLQQPNKLLAIMPGDRVAIFGQGRFNRLNVHKLLSQALIHFDLRPSFPVRSKAELDTFIEKFGS
ncbi:MAG: WD40 repeat domain-containing protein [Microscillaceae bacterium]|nr:WD40 repeat domain-containing protein [Microscillaceae bacterium]